MTEAEKIEVARANNAEHIAQASCRVSVALESVSKALRDLEAIERYRVDVWQKDCHPWRISEEKRRYIEIARSMDGWPEYPNLNAIGRSINSLTYMRDELRHLQDAATKAAAERAKRAG